jgi:hypothetical protein
MAFVRTRCGCTVVIVGRHHGASPVPVVRVRSCAADRAEDPYQFALVEVPAANLDTRPDRTGAAARPLTGTELAELAQQLALRIALGVERARRLLDDRWATERVVSQLKS